VVKLVVGRWDIPTAADREGPAFIVSCFRAGRCAASAPVPEPERTQPYPANPYRLIFLYKVVRLI
jgi:hypothetical protein